jgi:hypothetical protein
MERGTIPKHVEFYSKNKSEKLVHLVGYIIRTYKSSAVLYGSTDMVTILSELHHSVISCQKCNVCVTRPPSSYSCMMSELTHSDKQY